MNRGYIRSYPNTGGIERHLITQALADGTVAKATAAGQNLIGVTTEVDATAGKVTDIVLTRMPEVRYGGAVDFGDPLTTDANSRAIKLTDATAQNQIGICMAPTGAVADDIAPMLLAQRSA